MSHNPPQIDAATAMMLAADYVEQEQRFDFGRTCVPRTCQDKGCVLGWVGFVLGIAGLREAAQRLGYIDAVRTAEGMFYNDMRRACRSVEWIAEPRLAATGLRKLAQERGFPEPTE